MARRYSRRTYLVGAVRPRTTSVQGVNFRPRPGGIGSRVYHGHLRAPIRHDRFGGAAASIATRGKALTVPARPPRSFFAAGRLRWLARGPRGDAFGFLEAEMIEREDGANDEVVAQFG